jgi:hypothetical protein
MLGTVRQDIGHAIPNQSTEADERTPDRSLVPLDRQSFWARMTIDEQGAYMLELTVTRASDRFLGVRIRGTERHCRQDIHTLALWDSCWRSRSAWKT